MKTTLIFVRHGETQINRYKKLHKTNDLNELTELGKNQTKLTAKEVSKHKPDVVYSSKEIRAVQSAKTIAEECGVGLSETDGFQERNWGDFSGKTWPEIQAVLDKMSLEERYNYVPPNGESWKQFEKRLITKLGEIIKENKGRTIVIVTHGGSIRALMPHLLGVPREESFKYDPDNASLTIFNYQKGRFIKRMVNSTKHLEKLQQISNKA